MTARAAYWVWRRDLHVMLRAPIIYVVGGVFLVVQGVAFAGLVGGLSDPRRPAPLGALLEGQLAGTLLTWVLELVVLTLLGMRAVADDKRSGGWELLLTAQVGEGAAIVGKWLAATTVYALLWIPTLAYLGVVAVFRADDGGWDTASIATGYIGAIAIGAALLAWTVAASAAMSGTLGAGALGFALVMGVFLVGELPGLWPDLAVDHPALASGLDAISVRDTVGAFARGEVTLARVALVLGLTITGLSLAIALACAGRRRRGEVRVRLASTLGCGVISAILVTLAVRHPAAIDVTAERRNSLDPETRAVLAELPGQATLTIVSPTLGGLASIYDEVFRVARRMAKVAPGLTIREVDPASAPGGLTAIARAAGLQPGDLASGGAIVIDAGDRRKVIDLLAIATIDRSPDGAPRVERLAIEQALAGALAALLRGRPLTVCATTGHGELPIATKDPRGADWTGIADRLRGEGMTIEDVGVSSGVPARCSALIVAGPAAPFASEEALAVQAYVRGGGGLLVAAPSRTVSGGVGGGVGGGLGATGLEALLTDQGLGLPAAIVVDPSLTVRELPGALLVINGYREHPINVGFAGARPTLWFQPRPVLVTAPAQALVTASAASWGERDLVRAPPQRDDDDLAGPSILAAVGRGRVIVIGSAESMSTAVIAGGASAGDLWIARAVRYVAGAPDPVVDIAARAPEQVRLVMTSAQRTLVISLCVGGIPLAWVLIGGAIVLIRRRRAS